MGGLVSSGGRSPVHSGRFFRMESNYVHVYSCFNVCIVTLGVCRGERSVCELWRRTRRLVLFFLLSLLLPHNTYTHTLLLYRRRPSDCFALSWTSVSLVGNLVWLIWPYVACW